MRILLSRVVLATALLGMASRVWALGFETVGNTPIEASNYGDWPGVMPLINNEARVYQFWVNGNEGFFYRGDAAAVNAALVQFAAIESKALRVVLRPGPGEARNFRRDTIPCDWSLSLVGGIARRSPTLDQDPTLTIYVSTTIPVEKLVIPKDVQVSTIPELKDQSALLLKSADKTTRGWGAGKLAALDPYDTKSLDAVAALLKDDDTWVRGNAVVALSTFGAKARTKLADLKQAAETADDGLKTRIESLIAEIEKAPERAEAEREHRKSLREIDRFVDDLRKRK